jgi:gliding motility-associated-like protein
MQICSSDGSAMTLTFDSLNIQTGDTLRIYSGPSISMNLLAVMVNGTTSAANGYNAAACFTLVLKTDNQTEGSFGLKIHCADPCVAISGAINVSGEGRPALVCPNSNLAFHYAGNSSQPQSMRWDFGDGQDQSFSAEVVYHSYAEPGIYQAKMIFEKPGCPVQIVDSMQVWVSTMPDFSRLPNDTALCITSDFVAGLADVVDASTVLDSIGGWLAVPFQNMMGAFTPKYGNGCDSSYWSGQGIASPDLGCDFMNISFTQSGVYPLIYHVTNNFGCSFQDTVLVTYLSLPAVTAGPDVVIDCQPVTLQGGLLGVDQPSCSQAAGDYTYCYGNNDHHVATYCPDVLGSSKMRITLHSGMIESPYDGLVIHDGNNVSDAPLASSNWPLNGEIQESVFVAVNTTGCLTLEITSDFAVSCSDGGTSPLQYTVDCTDGYDFEWNWTPSTSLSVDDSSRVAVLSASQDITYTLTGWPRAYPECAVSDEVLVVVADPLNIQLPQNLRACAGDSILLPAPQITGGTAPYQTQWLMAGATIITADSTYYPANLNDSLCFKTTDGCAHQIQKCLFVSEYPVVDASFTLSTSTGCAPQQVVCTSDYTAYQNLARMNWQFGDGDTAMTMGSAAHNYWIPGSYIVSLEIIDSSGCVSRSSSADSLVIHPSPVSAFTTDSRINQLPNTNFFLNNLSQAADSFFWVIDDLATSSVESFNYKFPPNQTGDYEVTLIAYNNFGCTDTSQIILTIEDGLSVFIPNSFTPNGDGVNEVWQISTEGITVEKYHLQIFDKWGTLVYETTDPKSAWTGGTQTGDYYVSDGSYPYRLLVQDNVNEIMHEYTGSIMVIR